MDGLVKVKWLEGSPGRITGSTWGMPWEQGKLGRHDTLRLTDDEGQGVPMQCWPIAYWPDGSVKWSAHSIVAEDNSKKEYYVERCDKPEACHILEIRNEEDYIEVDTGKIKARLNKAGNKIIRDIFCKDTLICCGSRLVGIKEGRSGEVGARVFKEELFESNITDIELEQTGPIRAVIKVKGMHKANKGESAWLPFSLRLYFYVNTEDIKITHNFIYDGNAEVDHIKALGMEFDVPMKGPLYNRQVRLAGDTGLFSESCQFLSRRYARYSEMHADHVKGKLLETQRDLDGNVVDMVQDMAIWNNYKLIQDSSEHYVIQKNVKEGCSFIDADHGKRSKGLIYAGSESGGLAVGLKDFWQKHPSSLEVEGLGKDIAKVKMWFWSPDVQSMDLRHYDTETHVTSSYEGAEQLRSTPYGIGNTNELNLYCFSSAPTHEELLEATRLTQSPPLLICESEYYHKTKALGIWSLKDTTTKTKTYIEEQLDLAIQFYQEEVEQRKWYGFWHYGDFMHTYDPDRHVWKYDVGGFAWQNTELAPNMWLWYSFLRTGRSDIFRLAEAMTRHTSEVDVYHIGEYKGLGSRHNVIHWGCGCKEARIGMTGLHRYYYYLTADERIGDIFEEVKDADYSTLNIDPMREYHPKDQYPTHARSGPDWAAFSSNWFTRWERFEDEKYKEKILTGIQSLKGMPHRLLSGSCFGYDPEEGKLFYMGERTAGYHLAICMGEPQVWMEMAYCIPDQEWRDMLIELGEFYYLSREEKVKRTCEEISDDWDWPMFATGIAAYAAMHKKDEKLAKKAWDILLGDPAVSCMVLPIEKVEVNIPSYIKPINEIPSITTNTVSQWCLNTIVCLEMIGDYLEE